MNHIQRQLFFCHSYNDCGKIYSTVEIMMGLSFTELIGYPQGLCKFVVIGSKATRNSFQSSILVLQMWITWNITPLPTVSISKPSPLYLSC